MSNEQTTGSDGKATFENTAYGDYTLTIEADGYTTKTENIAFRSNHKNFTIALESASGTGTVTVTCVDSNNVPVTKIDSAFIYTGDVEPSDEDDSMVVALGMNGGGNVATLYLYDTTTHQPTEETAIPFGDYSLGAIGLSVNDITVVYLGTLTVDGDETVTITLTQD